MSGQHRGYVCARLKIPRFAERNPSTALQFRRHVIAYGQPDFDHEERTRDTHTTVITRKPVLVIHPSIMLRTQFIRTSRIPIRAIMATRGVADNAGSIPFRSLDYIRPRPIPSLTPLIVASFYHYILLFRLLNTFRDWTYDRCCWGNSTWWRGVL